MIVIAVFALRGQTPQNGDLLFQTEGRSAFSEAISTATARDSLGFVHVAILHIDEEGTPNVIEASPRAGVREITLEQFLEESPLIDGNPGVVVKRLTVPFPAGEAIERAREHIGEPYDWYFLPDNGMMYCSELIYHCYLTEDGTPIFSTVPMNFRSADGEMPAFWTELYEKLGMDVPEGLPGTNPNQISDSPLLEEVWRYF